MRRQGKIVMWGETEFFDADGEPLQDGELGFEAIEHALLEGAFGRGEVKDAFVARGV